jgi:UDP-N-acetylmuramyl pentapeptide phosphotransferase/UDP-N-acetylglucosamine-1-phosphate transferase
MIWILALSFLVTFIATLGVISSAHAHGQWSADHDLSGPQKMHTNAVPRIGGLGLAAGLLVGMIVMAILHSSMTRDLSLIALCALPAFAAGLLEDFTKKVSARRRLVAAAASAVLGYALLKAAVPSTGVGFIDNLAFMPVVIIALTIFAVTGVVHSVNIIDGMNGLASMCVALIMAALTYIALQVGDLLVADMALAVMGSVLGFFIWNYPRGLVFLGDGGAYLLGFLVAELGLMLIGRNPTVSPLAPLVLVAYPVFETVFTMYRRKVLQGRPVSQPDGVHLHTLLYRRLMRWAVGSLDAKNLTRGNSRTSPPLWGLCMIAVLPAAIWWNNTLALALTLLVFVFAYLSLYWRIVRFKTPAWLHLRQRKSAGKNVDQD